ncbi:MAG: tRNA 4-thiouridine(8) synthase ThiI [Clostridiales bacterium]|nr:tRNA 4-thiouridine(8) synthase ThiI [Candidatus Coliplasma caballi]
MSTFREIILLKYGEIVLKGLNRNYFNQLLERNVKRSLRHVEGEFTLEYSQSILFVRGDEYSDIDAAFAELQKVFGVVSLCKGWECEKDMDVILSVVREHASELVGSASTFKCDARRSDKQFPLTSPQIAAECGGVLLSELCKLKVDVRNPDVVVMTEIRDRTAIIHGNSVKGAGGMPVGCEGMAMLLLSGGIDSPVAGHMTARRGVELEAVYFETPPYTSEAAREKAVSLARKLAEYTGGMRLHSVSLTEVQEVLASICEERLFTLLLRRFVVRCAEVLARENGCSALITGESVGQVASQTMLSLVVTNEPAKLPVFRPCIGLDKEEIIVRARQIGTMEISSLPYEDCCAMFTPKHPNTHPTLDEIYAEEAKIDVEGLGAGASAPDHPEGINRPR